MSYQIFLGYLASGVALASYAPYLRDIFRSTTRPHSFSWFVWAVLSGIAFGVQLQSGAGAGAWVTGITAAACFAVFTLSLVRGHKEFVMFDFLSLAGALAAFVLWVVVAQPLASIFLVILIYFFGYLPTFRKTFYKPDEETLVTFALSGIKYFLGLLALETLVPLTYLFPLAMLILDFSFVGMALIRRRQLA